jgi:hypothetical protein
MIGLNRITQLAPATSAEGRTAYAESLLKRLRLSLRRYFLVSTGITTTALGLAIIASGLAVTYADSPRRAAEQLVHSADLMFAEASTAFAESAFSRYEPPPPPPAPPPEPPALRIQALSREQTVATGRITNVNLTFYDCLSQGFCGNMYNGRRVYEGAAACSWNLPIGTRFTIDGDPTGRVYICEDRGLLANTWIDVFWHDPADGWRWQAAVGRRGTIEIVEPR